MWFLLLFQKAEYTYHSFKFLPYSPCLSYRHKVIKRTYRFRTALFHSSKLMVLILWRAPESPKVKVSLLVAQSCLFATPWTAAHQAPLSMGFSRQGCWSGSPFPSPGDFPDPGIQPESPALQADSLPSEPSGKDRSPKSHHLSKFTVGKVLGAIHSVTQFLSTCEPVKWKKKVFCPQNTMLEWA